tara:strand:- start:471 stop:650 length:180 start_codon:yes stop_codon:yes gene_type:complete
LKKTSKEWQSDKPEKLVFDPDGWDRENFKYSWYEELITEEEYERRVSLSTTLFNIKEEK